MQRCLEVVPERPEMFIGQSLISLSTVPTVVGDSLVPRHVDLRRFIFSAPTVDARGAVGAHARRLGEGALVVNSSQDGGGKPGR